MNIISLSKRVAITVPSTVNVDQSGGSLQKEWVDRVLEKLSGLFGGATAIPGVGAWVSDVKGLVKEDVVIVHSFMSKGKLEEAKDATSPPWRWSCAWGCLRRWSPWRWTASCCW
jgi:hypothetical protein